MANAIKMSGSPPVWSKWVRRSTLNWKNDGCHTHTHTHTRARLTFTFTLVTKLWFYEVILSDRIFVDSYVQFKSTICIVFKVSAHSLDEVNKIIPFCCEVFFFLHRIFKCKVPEADIHRRCWHDEFIS